MNIVIAVDSFKGTLSSLTISEIVKKHYERQGHQVISIPISDGGEGFVESIQHFYRIEPLIVTSLGPLKDQIEAEYILKDEIAFIELCSTSGLSKITEDRLNPLKTSTYGLGILIHKAIKQGATKIILGVGGSATNDGGAGMVQALGVDFYHHDELLEEPLNGELIGKITHFDTTRLIKNIKGVEFQIASDVKNPLLGRNGCSNIYAGQKGANREQIEVLEEHMQSYADVVENYYKENLKSKEGAGAAGGVGFAALAFLKAKIHSGIDFMIELLEIEKQIEKADLVIVGEGKLDHQTIYGKAPIGIAKIAKKHQKKVIGIFALADDLVTESFIDEIHTIVPKYATIEESLSQPALYLEKMIENIKL